MLLKLIVQRWNEILFLNSFIEQLQNCVSYQASKEAQRLRESWSEMILSSHFNWIVNELHKCNKEASECHKMDIFYILLEGKGKSITK